MKALVVFVVGGRVRFHAATRQESASATSWGVPFPVPLRLSEVLDVSF